MNKIQVSYTLMWLFVLPFFITSCDNFEGEQQIPSYIKVEGFTLVENPDIQIPQDEGFLSTEISDAWVFVDNELIGAFPLPCSVPVLEKGYHKVEIRPGVIYNGMQGTREAYPFYTTAVMEMDLKEGQEVVFPTSEIMYNSRYATFPNVYEFFEEPYVSFALTDTTNGQKERMPLLSGCDSVKYGNGCGAIYFDNSGKNKYISIDSVHCTNKNGTVLEIDYHSNIPFEVGIYGRQSSTSAPRYVSVMRLKPNSEKGWQKMYILFNKAWGNLGFTENFRFYFEAFNPDGVSNGYIHIDNVKLIHYPNQY